MKSKPTRLKISDIHGTKTTRLKISDIHEGLVVVVRSRGGPWQPAIVRTTKEPGWNRGYVEVSNVCMGGRRATAYATTIYGKRTDVMLALDFQDHDQVFHFDHTQIGGLTPPLLDEMIQEASSRHMELEDRANEAEKHLNFLVRLRDE